MLCSKVEEDEFVYATRGCPAVTPGEIEPVNPPREVFPQASHWKGRSLILDVGCGDRRRLFTEHGSVIGLDIVVRPVYDASRIYDLVPFPDDHFDYVVSSDFLWHIPAGQKDALYQEFYGVLKGGGKVIHVIEADANNWHFRFATSTLTCSKNTSFRA